MIQSIPFRPQQEQFENIFTKAAALAEAIAQWHPFNDGNKRTALASISVFLQLNQYVLLEKDDTVDKILKLSQANLSLEEYSEWLRDSTILAYP